MDLTLFTVEEENLICIFNTSDKNTLMDNIWAAMPGFEEDELCEIADSVIAKIGKMSDEEYAAFRFNPAYFGGEYDETEEV